jgi:hypothetical protein
MSSFSVSGDSETDEGSPNFAFGDQTHIGQRRILADPRFAICREFPISVDYVGNRASDTIRGLHRTFF